MRFEVRAAVPGEEEAIVPLYAWLFAPPGSQPPDWDPTRAAVALRQAIDSHDAVVLVAVPVSHPDIPGREAEEMSGSGSIGREAEEMSGAGSTGREAEEVSGGIIGICAAYQDMHSVRFGYRAWVEDLAVHPDHRSAGVGKALLDAAKDWARERGATHLELDSALSRTDAHRFYEREGAEYKSFSFGWRL